MVRKMRSIFVFIMASTLVMGFQNCGETNTSNDQSVFNTDLSLMLLDSNDINNEISLYTYDKNTDEDTIFSIKRLTTNTVQVSENGTSYVCNINNENPFDLFIETINSIRISHPSRAKNKLAACSDLDLPNQYLIIESKKSVSYVVFKNDGDEECMSSNPEMLMRAGKRTFIAEEISSSEINEIVFNSQDMLDIMSCTEKANSPEISSLFN